MIANCEASWGIGVGRTGILLALRVESGGDDGFRGVEWLPRILAGGLSSCGRKALAEGRNHELWLMMWRSTYLRPKAAFFNVAQVDKILRPYEAEYG